VLYNGRVVTAKKLWALVDALLILVVVLAFVACDGATDIETTGVSLITSHDAGLGYDMCITCHGIGAADELEYPLDTAHIGQPDSSCLTPNCHVVVK
jgi:hypothetical protein